MKRGSDLLICTPGWLIEILNLKNGKLLDITFAQVLILDEADRMFDMGFEP